MMRTHQGARSHFTVISAVGVLVLSLTPSRAVSGAGVAESWPLGEWLMETLTGETIFEAAFLASCLAALCWVLYKMYLNRRSARGPAREVNRNFEKILEHLPLGVIHFDETGEVTVCNEAASRIASCADRDSDGLIPSRRVVHDEISRSISAALSGNWNDREVELREPGADGFRLVHIRLTPLPDAAGTPKGGLAVLEDITEHRRHRCRPEGSDARKGELVEFLPQVVYQLDPAGKFVFLNREGRAVLALSKDGLEGGVRAVEIVAPADREKIAGGIGRLLTGSESEIREEWTVLRSDGGTFPVMTYSAPIVRDGNIDGVAGLMVDIAEFKHTEERLRASLHQSEAFARKIHHRVKNDLQILSSLLYLQSRHVGDDRDTEVFRDTENRILTMALVHDTLCRSESPDRLDLNGYLQDLVDEILSSYEEAATRVRIGIDVRIGPCGIDTAIPLGLIVNELVGNFIKKAVPHSRSTEIRIALRSLGEEKVELTLRLDGIDSSEDLKACGNDSLEFNLVRTLVGQLHGQMVVEQTDGTTVRIEFQAAKGSGWSAR